MEAFIASFTLVALGEIGDKTQLLSFALANRYKSHWRILAGVIIATLINHGISAALGAWVGEHLPQDWLRWLLGGGFIALGLWMLVPDEDEEVDNPRGWGPFMASLVLFFLAEIGDKTQVATVALGARFPDAFFAVLLGTTLGMVATNLPAIWLGNRIQNPALETWAHRVSAVLFVGFGVYALLSGA
jgi:putative Ca2+/H+ antiporter (TMEM165/GDT1 family)